MLKLTGIRNKYDKAVDSQPDPVRSLLKAAKPVSTDPHMDKYRVAIGKARESFSPVLTQQLIRLIDEDNILDHQAEGLLEGIYGYDLLVDGTDEDSYSFPDTQLKSAMETLIESTTHSTKHDSLEKIFFIFVKATNIKKAELYIPFIDNSIKYSRDPNGTQTYSYPNGKEWDKRIDEIIPIFQKYCIEQLKNIEIETERGGFY